MVYTEEKYVKIVERCKSIASVFIEAVAAKRAPLDPVNNADDMMSLKFLKMR